MSWFVSKRCSAIKPSFLLFAEMTFLSSQPKPLDSTPASDMSSSSNTSSDNPEQRMLEKRNKVIEELLQTEKDYIKDLNMCVEEIIEPLQEKQVRNLEAPDDFKCSGL